MHIKVRFKKFGSQFTIQGLTPVPEYWQNFKTYCKIDDSQV